ncbi:IucA/IucC family siderophore biosynthesis protein [Streptomyces sp. ST2-7A]|nr:IucA/IucC family siderophore biosynthesis protein [Streptomyces sp. ST2-7A]MCE7081236.1 IucA/IucC family siderophore biosynthesis protein [Streptomyces sp. ST2-7A]
MLAEFAYEEVITPLPDDTDDTDDAVTPGAAHTDGSRAVAPVPAATADASGTSVDTAAPPLPPERAYRLPVGPDLCYHFRARRWAYGHWQVAPDSITPDADPLRFVALAGEELLGLTGDTTGHLIRELTATLAADTVLATRAIDAAALADLGYAELEGHQSGHPWLVANKGRIGFSASDAGRWAPEARVPSRLPWLAAHRDLARYRGVPALADARTLYERELDPEVRETFARTVADRGRDPDDYLWLPVHPWQWDNTIATLFAREVAEGTLIPLPTDGDRRLPQQSIRTFVNLDRPERRGVKLPLSVLNTLVWRGLPTERTLAAPAVTDWMLGLRDADPFLAEETRVVLLGETASVTVPHPLYDGLPAVPYQYRELLGCIWREPIAAHLDPGERARTLAALPTVGADGRALVTELVGRSGLDAEEWLSRLFSALLPPLLHFLYRYGTVFSPHGENAVVLFDTDDVPTRLAVKDFVDDVNLSEEPIPERDGIPEEVARILLTEPASFLPQFIHSGLFIGVFRYLAPVCAEHLGVPEGRFWALVRAEILRYQYRFPELKRRFETFDLLSPHPDRLCLNRNRLHLDGYRDRSERPHAAVHGTVVNPLHSPPPLE